MVLTRLAGQSRGQDVQKLKFDMAAVRSGQFVQSWTEPDERVVTQVVDLDRRVAHVVETVRGDRPRVFVGAVGLAPRFGTPPVPPQPRPLSTDSPYHALSIGSRYRFELGKSSFTADLLPAEKMRVVHLAGPRAGVVEIESIEIIDIRTQSYLVVWVDGTGATVACVLDALAEPGVILSIGDAAGRRVFDTGRIFEIRPIR